MRDRYLLVFFIFLVLFMGEDLASDFREGAGAIHLTLEGSISLMALGILVQLFREHRSTLKHRDMVIGDIGRQAEEWKNRVQDAAQRMGVAIDEQFSKWGLTSAERQVALLLLKGMSMREISVSRNTSERTVRQQTLAIYQKSGLSGRAELAAFFLEDLLKPLDFS